MVLTVLAVLGASSCKTRFGSFTVISTKNIDWSRAGEFERARGKVQGEDVLKIIIIFPSKYALSLEEAVDNALEKVPGAVALVNATLYADQMIVPGIYGRQRYVVTGTALVDPQLAQGPSPTGYLVLSSDGAGGFERREVDRADFDALLDGAGRVRG